MTCTRCGAPRQGRGPSCYYCGCEFPSQDEHVFVQEGPKPWEQPALFEGKSVTTGEKFAVTTDWLLIGREAVSRHAVTFMAMEFRPVKRWLEYLLLAFGLVTLGASLVFALMMFWLVKDKHVVRIETGGRPFDAFVTDDPIEADRAFQAILGNLTI